MNCKTRAPEGSISQAPPEGSATATSYSWIDDVVHDANSIVSEDAAFAYLASLLEPPSFELIHPTMEDTICDHPC
ncbi:MFS general substrate transporter [Sesbania bispinosa]|nr:MFS general substrate transporter [Sesbania bispinosa]